MPEYIAYQGGSTYSYSMSTITIHTVRFVPVPF
jgi:hypothetical protein